MWLKLVKLLAEPDLIGALLDVGSESSDGAFQIISSPFHEATATELQGDAISGQFSIEIDSRQRRHLDRGRAMAG